MNQFLKWAEQCGIDPNSPMGQLALEAWQASRQVLIQEDDLSQLAPEKKYIAYGELNHPTSGERMRYDLFHVGAGLTRIEMQRTRQALTLKSYDHIVSIFVESGLLDPLTRPEPEPEDDKGNDDEHNIVESES